MQCKYCEEPTAYHTAVCRVHGAHKIRTGVDAPNYRHGEFTKEALESSRVSRLRIRALCDLGYDLGMFRTKMRGRKPGQLIFTSPQDR